MKKMWAVYSQSGFMLTPYLVLKEMDAEDAETERAAVPVVEDEERKLEDITHDRSREGDGSRPP